MNNKNENSPGASPVDAVTHHFFLSIRSVDDFVARAWVDWLGTLSRRLGIDTKVYLDRSLDTAFQNSDAIILKEAGEGVFTRLPNREIDQIVTVSDSRVISRSLLKRFNNLIIRCQSPPVRISASLWPLMLTQDESDQKERTRNPGLSDASGPEPWNPDCTLITSLFDGDVFLEGFLRNSAALDGYHDLEHFIVRPGSPGVEHDRLCAHIDVNPGVIYVWLPEDPGLYEVWNLCIRLASAPYLSSANIDDRRAPSHVRRLSRLLDKYPEVDVVSSALRVSLEKNLSWEDSDNDRLWFADEPEALYSVDRLVERRDGAIASRNIPHCMPLWRRELHVRHGLFDEKRYGPSADWEFWLRSGSRGTRFYIEREPLGVYFRSEQSYWRRNDAAAGFDRRIIASYVVQQEPPGVSGSPEIFSAMISECLQNARQGDSLRCLWTLGIIRTEAMATGEKNTALQSVTESLFQRLLACSADDLPSFGVKAGFFSPGTSGTRDQLARLISELLHLQTRQGRHNRRQSDFLQNAMQQHEQLFGPVDMLLGRAWLAGVNEQPEAEQRLLGMAYAKSDASGEKGFWSRLQAFYRFSRSLEDICSDLEALPRFSSLEDIKAGQTLYFLPDYTATNPYQHLLYRSLEKKGIKTTGIDGFAQLLKWESQLQAGDVLHIHWMTILYRNCSVQDHGRKMSDFLACLERLKSRSVRIYWTIHNRYSHDVPDIELEHNFRTELCLRADRIFIHHPCLLDEVKPWLRGNGKIRFIEHGSYVGHYENELTRSRARRQMGMEQDNALVAVIGQVRPYKALPCALATLRGVMSTSPSLKLVLAGKVLDPAVQQQLDLFSDETATVNDAFIEDSEFQVYLNAADFVLLSYRDILTSGSLFQAFSFGVPVIAPALGSLPSYVVDGWNGYVYESPEELEAIFTTVARLRPEERQLFRKNASRTARSLRWPGADAPVSKPESRPDLPEPHATFTIGFAVTDDDPETTAGDFFSASELAGALNDAFGWKCVFLSSRSETRSWYDCTGLDCLVTLIDNYKLHKVFNASPGLIKVAWLRNWIDRWPERHWFNDYDLALCSSDHAAEWIRQHASVETHVLRIAANTTKFKPETKASQTYSSDYCFTGSFWGAPRQIAQLNPGRLPYTFALFGHGWSEFEHLKDSSRGPVPYADMPGIYASTRLLIDDANHATLPWGSVNSRVFDALAAGVLVLSNGAQGAQEVFGDLLPTWSSIEELEEKIRYFLDNETERLALTEELRTIVLKHHSYERRARELKTILQPFMSQAQRTHCT